MYPQIIFMQLLSGSLQKFIFLLLLVNNQFINRYIIAGTSVNAFLFV